MNKDVCRTSSGELDLYTLDEASAKTHCSVPSILKMAADGRISIFTTIPIGWQIYGINTSALPPCQYKNSVILFINFGPTDFGPFEKSDPAIELLILSTEDCKNIATFNYTKQGAFKFGLTTTYDHPPSEATPAKKKSISNMRRRHIDPFPSLSRCFAICKKPTSKEEIIDWNVNRFPYQETIVTKDTIRITHGELEKILEEATTREPEEARPKALNNEKNPVAVKKTYLKNISQRLYTPGKAQTKLLETLYKVAKHSWETYRATGKYPRNSELETNIKAICTGCSNSLAQKSATMIRPPSYDRNESSEFFLTNYFWALIDTNEKFYRQSPSEEIDKESVLRWLEIDLKFESSLALAGSRITDPDFEANKSVDT